MEKKESRRLKGRQALKLFAFTLVLTFGVSMGAPSWAGLSSLFGSVSLPAESIRAFFGPNPQPLFTDYPLSVLSIDGKVRSSQMKKEGDVAKELDNLVRGTLAILRSA
jgi:hypothetical protein